MNNKTKHIHEARAKYNAYDTNVWEKACFDEDSGGFNVYHKEHQFAATDGGGDAEKEVGKLLAEKNAKQVEFLPELGEMSADLFFDMQTWEIKYINYANVKTIRGYIENVRRKDADNGIFYWDNWNNTERIDFLRAALASEIGKMKKLGRIDEMPNIYYMDKEGMLKLFWKK